MELYILDNNYNRADIIEEFESIIWTERFIDPGDMQLVIQGTWANYKLLAPGTLIGLRGSKEVMLLEDRSVEDGLMTVKGKTLEYFFDERFVDKGVHTGVPGEILGSIVDAMQSRHDGDHAIPRLRTGTMDNTGTREIKVVPFGPVHTTLLEFAKKHNIGMAVHWLRLSNDTHELVFVTRTGVNRTTHQTDYPMVRFSPHLENLANIKEFFSVADSKSSVVVLPPNIPSAEGIEPMRFSNVIAPVKTLDHFKERILEISCSDVTEQMLADVSPDEKFGAILEVMINRGEKALAYNKKTRVVDGEITPSSKYKYGKDYLLGDSVEIQGRLGDATTGIVSEHIRSQDGTGERSYPTVSAPADAIVGNISNG